MRGKDTRDCMSGELYQNRSICQGLPHGPAYYHSTPVPLGQEPPLGCICHRPPQVGPGSHGYSLMTDPQKSQVTSVWPRTMVWVMVAPQLEHLVGAFFTASTASWSTGVVRSLSTSPLFTRPMKTCQASPLSPLR